jgi:oxygen-independent coproporphyrinogen-3 oxidase
MEDLTPPEAAPARPLQAAPAPPLTVADLARYSIEAPRYTSYPTALEFSPAVGAADHATFLRQAAERASAPLSLYVHLPFCREICHFCGCHALVARTEERRDRYEKALAQEIALVASRLGARRQVLELHFGGGSPSFLPARAFRQIMTTLAQHFAFERNAIVSLEADPRTTDEEKLVTYREAGVRRISFGFQDLDPDVQEAIGRHQSAEVSRQVFRAARRAGFNEINVDLCYGLPRQTPETFSRTIEDVLDLRPERVAIFGYAHVPWAKPKQKLIVVDDLPPTDVRLALVALARQKLLAAGYRAIGLDHFALPSDELAQAAEAKRLHRNFQGYTTTNTDALVGLGLSAISELDGGYAQNARALGDYYDAIDAGRLPTERGVFRTDEDRLRWAIIREIMCTFALDVLALERRTGLVFAETFAAESRALARLEAEGLVTLQGSRVVLTSLGQLFARNVAVVFDAYRKKGGEEARGDGAGKVLPKRFSRSI